MFLAVMYQEISHQPITMLPIHTVTPPSLGLVICMPCLFLINIIISLWMSSGAASQHSSPLMRWWLLFKMLFTMRIHCDAIVNE